MAKKGIRIEGFYDRLDEACRRTGLTKREIARRCGFNVKTMYASRTNYCMNSGYVARFCAVTKTDANWLLGLKGEKNDS